MSLKRKIDNEENKSGDEAVKEERVLSVFYNHSEWDRVVYAFLTYGGEAEILAEFKKHTNGTEHDIIKNGLHLIPDAEDFLERTSPSCLRHLFALAEETAVSIDKTAVLVWDLERELFFSVEDIVSSPRPFVLESGSDYSTAQEGFHLVTVSEDESPVSFVLAYLPKGVTEEKLPGQIAMFVASLETKDFVSSASPSAKELETAEKIRIHQERLLKDFLDSFSFSGTSERVAVILARMFTAGDKVPQPSVLLEEAIDTMGNKCTWSDLIAEVVADPGESEEDDDKENDEGENAGEDDEE